MEADPLNNAIETLKLQGKTVVPADIPGLYFVDGRELTTGQVLDFARQLQERR